MSRREHRGRAKQGVWSCNASAEPPQNSCRPCYRHALPREYGRQRPRSVARLPPQRAVIRRRSDSFVKTVESSARRQESGPLTVYAFSTGNWNRSDGEVGALMRYEGTPSSVRPHAATTENIRTCAFWATFSRFEPDARARGWRTASPRWRLRGMTLSVALSYGGRDEIVPPRPRAKHHERRTLSAHLYTAACPTPIVIPHQRPACQFPAGRALQRNIISTRPLG